MPAVLQTNPGVPPEPSTNQEWYVHEITDSDNIALQPIEPATQYIPPKSATVSFYPQASAVEGGSSGVIGLILNNFA